MKKKFYYASLAFAGIIGMSACSKEENVAVAEKQIVDELTIKIDGSAGSRAGGVSTPEGNENGINDVALFVKVAEDAEGSSPKYKRVKLGQNSNQATVKFAVAGSAVYAVANGDLDGKSIFGDDPYGKYTESGVDDPFDTNIKAKVSKGYVGNLTSDGYFLMSGKANVVSGKNQETLVVSMARDLAKVSFSVNSKVGADEAVNGKYYRPKLGEVKGIVIKRSSQNVQQFKVDGPSESGYELDMSYGKYVEDYPAVKEGTATFNDWDKIEKEILNINNVQKDVSGGSTSTDYTFAYKWGGSSNDNNYTFNDFYVLPNYAQTKKNSTVVILATKVQESTVNTAESEQWTDGTEGAKDIRYYKARISDSFEAFGTHKNKHYVINAKLKGPGKGTIEDALKEDAENDLYISVQVQDWALVVSNQDIQ